MVYDAIQRGKRCAFMVHRKELVDQFAGRLKSQFGVSSGIVMPGHKQDYSKPSQVCSIPSLLRRDAPPADLVFFDEAHRIKAESWMQVLEKYPNAYKIFLTATPERLDKKGFDDVADAIVNPINTATAIQEKWLVPTETWAPLEVGLDGVRTRAGDYRTEDLFEIFRDDRVMKGVYEGYQEFMPGKKVIIYSVNVDLSKLIAQFLLSKGIPAAHLDGTTSRKEREAILKDFRSGKIRVLSNVQILTEGFDVPDCEGVILNVATKSKGKFVQCVGRAMRPVWNDNHTEWRKDGDRTVKEAAYILDYGGNTVRHGLVDYYGMEGFTLAAPKKGFKTDNEGRRCPECLKVSPPSTSICECGYEFPQKPDTKLYADEVTMEKIEHFEAMAFRWNQMSKHKLDKEPTEFLRIIGVVMGYDWRWAIWKAYHRGEVPYMPKRTPAAKASEKELERIEKAKGTYQMYLMAKAKFK
jgi:superfamily II DNA or RNA helicase